MIDLDVVVALVCNSVIHWEKKVIGSKGKEYTVKFAKFLNPTVHQALYGWQCDCLGFKYSNGKPCRHIRQVTDSGEWCGFNIECEPNLAEQPGRDANGVPVCPKCGGPMTGIKVAI